MRRSPPGGPDHAHHTPLGRCRSGFSRDSASQVTTNPPLPKQQPDDSALWAVMAHPNGIPKLSTEPWVAVTIGMYGYSLGAVFMNGVMAIRN